MRNSPKIVGVGKASPRSALPEVLTPQLVIRSLQDTMQPRLILELMASLFDGENPESVTITDALNALLAQRVLHEKGCIPDSSDSPDLVLMVSGVVARFMRRVVCEDSESLETPFQDQILADLRVRIVTARDSVSRFFSALQLGDRALHLASGWIGQRDFVRRTNALERRRYATAMAQLGYGTAFDLSHDSGGDTSMIGTGASLQFLFCSDQRPDQQIHRAVQALSGLRSEEERVRGLINGQVPYTVGDES